LAFVDYKKRETQTIIRVVCLPIYRTAKYLHPDKHQTVYVP